MTMSVASIHTPQPPVVIRTAADADRPALIRLAALDSAPELAGPALVAEVGDRIVAALDTATGARIADPFAPTADVLDLLELRAHPRRRAA
jgi:hypothetical protein